MKKEFKGMLFESYNPEECKTPKNTRVAEILIDVNEYVLAKIHYQNEAKPSLAIRWHFCEGKEDERMKNGEKCIGYPNIFGRPTWFVLPDTLLGDIQNILLENKGE